MILRNFRKGDKRSFLLLVNSAYRNLETLTKEQVARLTSPPYFCPEGFFMAEEDDLILGCVGVFNLPATGHLEIRYLAIEEALSNRPIVDMLVEAALKYSVSKKPRMVKAVTLTIQPYVEAYKRFGFKSVRRILRIAWDPLRIPEEEQLDRRTTLVEIVEKDIEEASQVFVNGVQPYWDWWVEEEGGKEILYKNAADWLRQSKGLAAKVNDEIVGVTSVVPNPERSEAGFYGVIVLPAFRTRGIGSLLMKAALNKARQLGYERMVVHTLAYVDTLAPGAVLYLKSGGRIEAEYLHLVKEFGS